MSYPEHYIVDKREMLDNELCFNKSSLFSMQINHKIMGKGSSVLGSFSSKLWVVGRRELRHDPQLNITQHGKDMFKG